MLQGNFGYRFYDLELEDKQFKVLYLTPFDDSDEE